MFPLCDSRGYVSGVLKGDTRMTAADCHPESIFLAWLLDLPAGVDPAQAALTLLLISGCLSDPPSSSSPTRLRLYKLMREAADSD